MKEVTRDNNKVFIPDDDEVFEIGKGNQLQCERQKNGSYDCYIWTKIDEIVKTILVEGVDGVNLDADLRSSTFLRRDSFSTTSNENAECSILGLKSSRYLDCIGK